MTCTANRLTSQNIHIQAVQQCSTLQAQCFTQTTTIHCKQQSTTAIAIQWQHQEYVLAGAKVAITSKGARWSQSEHWGACALRMAKGLLGWLGGGLGSHSRKGVQGCYPLKFFGKLAFKILPSEVP